MSFRNAIAGPSRPRLPSSPSTFLLPLRPQHRSLTIPHPDLDPSRGQTHLSIRYIDRTIPSTLHAFAMIREVERKFGPTWYIEIPRDPDTNQYRDIINLTLVRPIQLKPGAKIDMKIPSPILPKPKDHYLQGGPSLRDLHAVMEGTHKVYDKPKDGSFPEYGRKPVIAFSVSEVPDSPKFMERRKERLPIERPKIMGFRSEKLVEEDRRLYDVLKRLGDGPNGGFKGLAEELEDLLLLAKQEEPGPGMIKEDVEELRRERVGENA